MKDCHTHLTNKEEKFVWSRNEAGGTYNPILGYSVLIEEDHNP